MERLLTIGQLAHATGVAAKTIRYYEQVGVLPAPRRSAAGYRQYAQRDVHRLLFIRRARALGLSLHSLKTLTGDLESGSAPSMGPRLQHLVTEHLHAVRQRIADFQLLEQQLEQVLQRLQTMRPTEPGEECRCLESEAAPSTQWTLQPPPPLEPGGADLSPHPTMESLTRLAATSDANRGCGCGCASGGASPLIQLLLLQPVAASAGRAERRPRVDGAGSIAHGDDTPACAREMSSP